MAVPEKQFGGGGGANGLIFSCVLIGQSDLVYMHIDIYLFRARVHFSYP